MRAPLRFVLVACAMVAAACSGGAGEPASGTRPAPTAGVTTAPGGGTTSAPATTTTVASPPTTTASTTTPTAAPTTTTAAPTTTIPLTTTLVAETADVELVIGDRTRFYRLTLPDRTGAPIPLVVDLHGLTADPESQEELSSMAARGQAESFAVAQPLGLGLLASWSAGSNPAAAEDVAFLEAVVADVAARTAIDSDRVYASGFSNGGGMASRLACDAAETFAAVASVAGSYVEHLDCDPSRPVSVVAFHGTADFIVPFDGFAFLPEVEAWARAWALRNGCAPEPVEDRLATDVVLREWLGCRGGTVVALYVIEGGGHGWPGTSAAGRRDDSTPSIEATAVIWDFFAAHAATGG